MAKALDPTDAGYAINLSHSGVLTQTRLRTVLSPEGERSQRGWCDMSWEEIQSAVESSDAEVAGRPRCSWRLQWVSVAAGWFRGKRFSKSKTNPMDGASQQRSGSSDIKWSVAPVWAHGAEAEGARGALAAGFFRGRHHGSAAKCGRDL